MPFDQNVIVLFLWQFQLNLSVGFNLHWDEDPKGHHQRLGLEKTELYQWTLSSELDLILSVPDVWV